jgi:predicted flap endonuclease-1-like 5' DNA nuclease
VIWILLLVVVAVAFAAGWLYGKHHDPIDEAMAPPPKETTDRDGGSTVDAEHARIIRSFESETARLRSALGDRDDELARERAETSRYRELVIDLENNAPPPLLDSPTTPDDLKMIVGVGPVLERMLYQLGIATYRQIARWTERDIDEIDARLPEFPGRIRRDAWVTQARALHQSKYGETL